MQCFLNLKKAQNIETVCQLFISLHQNFAKLRQVVQTQKDHLNSQGTPLPHNPHVLQSWVVSKTLSESDTGTCHKENSPDTMVGGSLSKHMDFAVLWKQVFYE